MNRFEHCISYKSDSLSVRIILFNHLISLTTKQILFFELMIKALVKIYLSSVKVWINGSNRKRKSSVKYLFNVLAKIIIYRWWVWQSDNREDRSAHQKVIHRAPHSNIQIKHPVNPPPKTKRLDRSALTTKKSKRLTGIELSLKIAI